MAMIDDIVEVSDEDAIGTARELSAEDESFELPDWAGLEVTGDRRYYNSELTKHPFSTWE